MGYDSVNAEGRIPGNEDYYFTNYSEVNRILNNYVKEAHAQHVRVSIDGSGFAKNKLGESFPGLIALVMEEAFRSCLEMRAKNRRVLKIRTMEDGGRIFVKAVYPTREWEDTASSQRIGLIRTLLERSNSYFKVVEQNDEKAMLIAIRA